MGRGSAPKIGPSPDELIGKLVLLLMRHGVPPDEASYEISLLCHDFDIVPKQTDLVPYEGTANDLYLKKFILAKKIAGCTDRTLGMYYQSIGKALREMGKPIRTITSDDITYCLGMMMRRGCSRVTANNTRRSLSSFFAWLQNEEIITANPMVKVERIKEPIKKKHSFSDVDVEKMRMVLTTWREKTIFEMLLSTACRVSELVNIRVDQINGNQVEVLGKGEKTRIVYLNAKARLSIEKYMSERKDANPYLFPRMVSVRGRPNLGISPKNSALWYCNADMVMPDGHTDMCTIEAIIRKIGQRSGVENAHPHRFRRTCATNALRKGMPIELVSKMLGHADISTTQIYLDLSETDLKSAHEKYVT